MLKVYKRNVIFCLSIWKQFALFFALQQFPQTVLGAQGYYLLENTWIDIPLFLQREVILPGNDQTTQTLSSHCSATVISPSAVEYIF